VDTGEQVSAQRAAQRPNRRAPKVVAGLVGLAAAAAIGGVLVTAVARGRAAASPQTVAVARGDLIVSVTEGGALQAIECLKLKNEAQPPWDPESEYKRAIVFIVDEGTIITEQGVEDGMVLARLDSSDLEEREAQAQIWSYYSEAAYAQARESYEIQRKQNQSDIAIAELNVRFARMELERYLGAGVAAEVVKEKGGFAELADDAGLGGAAQRDLHGYTARVELASAELSQAEERLRWTKQLHERKWVSSPELMADQYRVNRGRRELEAAREELRLARRYTLPKEAKRRYSDYAESMRNLARTEAQGRSRLAQAEANLKSSKASYELNQERLQKIRDSIKKCTIRAPKPGRVVYASTTDPWRRMNDPVQQGQRLWPWQSIILIPDLSTLAARVNIHETDIEKIKLGQPALVSVEAMPGKHFPGTVARIGSVASLAQAWTNPELRVYEVDVALSEMHEGLTPGMTVTAQIIVAQRKDVLYVPIGAVDAHNGQWVCSVAGPRGSEFRRIDVGQITEDFVEVEQGLSEGEAVYLTPRVEVPGAPARGSGTESIPTVPVARGDLTVSVAERGAVYSMKPLEVKSAVPSWNLLLEVVDEGTVITEKDVQEGLVLARFDSSNLEEEESNRLIGLYGAEAAYAQARENLEIQKGQNESNIALAELNAEFGRMELERYVGEDLAAQAGNEDSDSGGLADDPRLGGVARQELRNYESQRELAAEELLRADQRLTLTRNLCQNGYLSRNELTADELSVAKLRAELEAAEGNHRLFKRYTLPIQVRQRSSDCMELARELERVEARAASQLAQAEAQLRSCEAVYELQKEGLEKVRDKIAKCTMRALRPGQVIYGSRLDPIWYRWGDSAIRPGVFIEENRTIISIPDPSTLAAVVNIREADIRNLEVGQRAVVALEAVPGRTFTGRVARMSPVAISADASLNPEAKVYETEVALEEMPEHFIPGMSATVEIITAELHDVLYVPRQAVNRYKELSYCWVNLPDGPQARCVETGHTSVSYAEIRRGLRAGEEVFLAEPQKPAQDELDALTRLQGAVPDERS
jgi:HlyD family secretion protein